ncbi:YidC/Oxa1 family membrane protein insertase [Thalassotalea piscium]|uniref:Membrane protein insertase Oxa1/YidC/SpoIIIJ n=1 Tax=Thalassotalea piscium TaxID=1230533 RepID=A0A7X0NGJ0_9GAMM|nr:YidC/Oxa1 family membrane protein insertase [Thalassotalea piscium]MBB6543056.1 membrane protein insertase Oxa1/YidC/SpoIIIJ [Thalassotalea piscium]
MSNKELYLYSALLVITAMLTRLTIIDGSTYDVLFNNQFIYTTHIQTLVINIFDLLKNTYLIFISSGDYLLRYVLVLFLFRVLLLPLDIIIQKSQNLKALLTPEVLKIKDRETSLKDQGMATRNLYKENNIKPMMGAALMIFKVLLTIVLFLIVKDGFVFEPVFLVDYRLMINILLGTLLFPIVYLANKGQDNFRSNKFYLLGLPSLLYVCGILYFTVSLCFFILVMQLINMGISKLQVGINREIMVKRNQYDKAY